MTLLTKNHKFLEFLKTSFYAMHISKPLGGKMHHKRSNAESKLGAPLTATSKFRGLVFLLTLSGREPSHLNVFVFMKKWAASWQSQQNDCAPSEDFDQPGHPPSLIRVFAVRMKKAWVLSYPLRAQRRLWSDSADAQADRSLRWAHRHFVGFVMRRLK